MKKVEAIALLLNLRLSDEPYGQAVFGLYMNVYNLCQNGGGEIEIHDYIDEPLGEWFWGAVMEQQYGGIQLSNFTEAFGYKARWGPKNGKFLPYGHIVISKLPPSQ